MANPNQPAELLYLLAGDPAELAGMLVSMRSADVAERLNELPPAAAARIVAALPFDLAVQVLDEPELERRRAIIEHTDETVAGSLIEAMSADQQADLFRRIAEPERSRLFRVLEPSTRDELQRLLRYPPESAGGIMTTELVSVPGSWTVEKTLRHISRVGRAKETVYAVYVLDDAERLAHVVSLRELLVSDRRQSVLDVGDRRRPITTTPQTDREEVARLIGKYNLLAIPVLDDDGHVIGIVTVDDVIDALVAEETEDVQKLGGMEALDAPYLEIGLPKMIRKRAGWLAALFLGEMLTATAMSYFQDEIARAVVLALFVPLIISSGGNSGAQATTLVIRAMALGQVRRHGDWWRVVRREFSSGAVLGCILGALGVVRILLWQAIGDVYGPHYLLIAITLGVSLIGVVLWGTIAGSMLPFVLRRLRFDPASASAPFVATLVDVTGVVIYFTAASLILRGTLL